MGKKYKEEDEEVKINSKTAEYKSASTGLVMRNFTTKLFSSYAVKNHVNN